MKTIMKIRLSPSLCQVLLVLLVLVIVRVSSVTYLEDFTTLCEKLNSKSSILVRTSLYRRFIKLDTSKALHLFILPDTVCLDESNKREDEEALAVLTKVAQVATMVNGPFVSYSHMISINTLLDWLSEHNLSSIAVNLPFPAILLFDNFTSPQSYYRLSLPSRTPSPTFHLSLPYPLTLKPFLESRYKLKVHFKSPHDATISYELYWVHFRGNSQVTHIGTIPPRGELVQYTSAGHLYMLTIGDSSNHNPTFNASKYTPFDHHIHLPSAVSLLLMPSIHIQEQGKDEAGLVVTLTHSLILKGMNLEILREYSDVSEYGYESSIKNMLLTYWQLHRQVQMPPSMWALRPLHLSSIHHSLANSVSTSTLWTRFSLPSELFHDVKTEYLARRTGLEDGQGEGFISLVFNQHVQPTHHIPLSATLMSRLSSALLAMSEEALSMPPQSLSIVSAYGVREYRTGAIIRPHVDPTLSSPLTAILHMHSDCHPVGEGDEREPCWPFHIPQYLGAEEGGQWVGRGLGECVAVGVEGDASNYSCINSPANSNLVSIEQKEGEVLLLHTAQVPHARLIPYTRGSYYGNLYVHMRTQDWEDREEVRALD